MGVLIDNGSATSAGTAWNGGRGQFSAVATWGGGNVVLQYLGPNGSTWLPVGTALTADGFYTFELAPGQIRAAVTTATAVYARVDQTKG